MSLPVLDYNDLTRDRGRFLSELRRALADVGFLVLANAPGLGDDFQQRAFREVRAFFDAPAEEKKKASINKTPYFRGHSKATPGGSGFCQVIEAFQYAFDQPKLAEHDDKSVAIHRRLFRGPNTWPDQGVVPGFRPAVEELSQVYLRLTHELGHLICECLDEDPARFREYFKFDDPDLAASLNKNFSMASIAPSKREHVRKQYAKPKSLLTGAHIDGPPFLALLVNDRPGLEVVAGEGKWIAAPVTCRTAPGAYPVPVIPGSVIVNSGGTLQHLSRGRIGATLHRVNTTLIPDGDTRVSLPFFLIPKPEGPLVPFGLDEAEDTESGYNKDRDRGVNASVNRMGTFPQCTKRWWAEEYKELRAVHAEETARETQAAYDLANRRAAQNKAAARL